MFYFILFCFISFHFISFYILYYNHIFDKQSPKICIFSDPRGNLRYRKMLKFDSRLSETHMLAPPPGLEMHQKSIKNRSSELFILVYFLRPFENASGPLSEAS